jgi:ectoine hydroxylase-related dioxygenase (phytanoyl-CoA dioxygenase family)
VRGHRSPRPARRSFGGGTRCLLPLAWCAALACRLRLHPALSGLIPAGHVAVQCTYFEKSASRNWLVPIHQDLSIPVACRVDAPGLRGWSEKEGALFVQAPAELLAQLVAVRVHLDACGADDGPLRVLPGSHRLGLVAPEAAVLARNAAAEVTCEAAPGDALVMRPLLLHASSKASGQSRRRVLHFVFGPPLLTHGLAWRQAV